MAAADTAIAKARQVFSKHGGMLRTSKAMRLGIHPRTLWTLATSNRSDADSTGSPRHHRFQARTWCQSRSGFHGPSFALSRPWHITG